MCVNLLSNFFEFIKTNLFHLLCIELDKSVKNTILEEHH